jgi:LuxR family quorum-sensing system transcriptional regulator CciR
MRPVAIVQEFIDASVCAATLAELTALYRVAISKLDCEHFALVHLGERASSRDAEASPVVAVDYPESWVRRYLSEDYFRVDPVIRQARRVATPYEWSSIGVLSAEEREFLDEARDAGLRHGISVPVHEPHGRVFLASVATSQCALNAKLVRPVVHMLVVQFHARFCEIARSLDGECFVRLTARERECLQWTARGKSSWDISRLIGISEHTVNFHVKNAMGKLGTGSRVSAVAKCVSMGLIAP